jgi:hypothetical protein
VEGEVGPAPIRVGAVHRGVLELPRQRVEPRQRRCVEMRQRRQRGIHLQQRADREQILQPLHVGHRHAEAAEGHVLHDPAQRQLRERGPHLEAVRVQAAFEVNLPQPFARAILAGAQDDGDLKAELAFRAGLGRHADPGKRGLVTVQGRFYNNRQNWRQFNSARDRTGN